MAGRGKKKPSFGGRGVRHVKRGDEVVVIAGNDKGRTGEVKHVDHEKNRVVVEGINMRWRHRRPTRQGEQGERVQEESPIHASNVLPLGLGNPLQQPVLRKKVEA